MILLFSSRFILFNSAASAVKGNHGTNMRVVAHYFLSQRIGCDFILGGGGGGVVVEVRGTPYLTSSFETSNVTDRGN
jgi:hypothetical protein